MINSCLEGWKSLPSRYTVCYTSFHPSRHDSEEESKELSISMLCLKYILVEDALLELASLNAKHPSFCCRLIIIHFLPKCLRRRLFFSEPETDLEKRKPEKRCRDERLDVGMLTFPFQGTICVNLSSKVCWSCYTMFLCISFACFLFSVSILFFSLSFHDDRHLWMEMNERVDG